MELTLVETEKGLVVTGNTFSHKDALKQMHGRWNPLDKSCVVPLKYKSELTNYLASGGIIGEAVPIVKGPKCSLCREIGHNVTSCPTKLEVKSHEGWRHCGPLWGKFRDIDDEDEKKLRKNWTPGTSSTCLKRCFCLTSRLCIVCEFVCCVDAKYVVPNYSDIAIEVKCATHGLTQIFYKKDRKFASVKLTNLEIKERNVNMEQTVCNPLI
jgi:hypothetical protein